MHCFLQARGYTLLSKDQTNLDFTAIHDTVVKSVKRPQKTHFELEKSELPHALTCVLNGALFVHIVQKTNGEQAFLLVASNEETAVIGKAQLTNLLEKSTEFAHTIIILNEISPQAKTLMISFNSSEGNRRNHIGELILKKTILFEKLRSKYTRTYKILNIEEVKAIEKKYGKKEDFPWIYEQEPMARYFGLVRGMVVQTSGDPPYRLVVENELT